MHWDVTLQTQPQHCVQFTLTAHLILEEKRILCPIFSSFQSTRQVMEWCLWFVYNTISKVQLTLFPAQSNLQGRDFVCDFSLTPDMSQATQSCQRDWGQGGAGGRAVTWGTCSALDCVEHVLETVDGDFKRNRGGEHPAEDLSFSSAWIAAPMALDSISIWGATYRPMPWAPRCTCSVYHCRAGGLFCHGWAREAGRCCIVLCSHL